MATANAMFTIVDTADVNMNGRNLVLKSHEEHSRTVSSSGADSVVPYYSYSDFASEFTHRKGQILTVSFDYETIGNALSAAYIYAQHNESQISMTPAARCKAFILDNPSGHYSRTFTVTTNQSTSSKNTIRVYYKSCSPGTVIKIKNIKVEIGDEETPWTPAPEDITTAISDANEAKELAESKNSVYYQTTAPTGTLKVGDTWFDTDNDYKISKWGLDETDGVYKWLTVELGDQAIGNLDASHINTGTLAAVQIQVGKANNVAGSLFVYDENDNIVGRLNQNGIRFNRGAIGEWDISNERLLCSKNQNTTSSNTHYTMLLAPFLSQTPLNDAIALTKVYEEPNNPSNDYQIRSSFSLDNIFISKLGYANPNDLSQKTILHSTVYSLTDLMFDSVSHVHWSVLSPVRTVKDTLKVTIYRCGNLFWAHFSGSIAAGWNGAQNVYLSIINNDDANYTKSKLCAPPEQIDKYIQPQTPSTARPVVRVNTDGTIGLYYIIKSMDNVNWTTVADNMETCDIFWAHVEN